MKHNYTTKTLKEVKEEEKMKDKNCDERTNEVRLIKGSEVVEEHEEAWYRNREHWSEVHGWN